MLRRGSGSLAIEGAIRLVNTTDAAVVLTRIQTSCACLQPQDVTGQTITARGSIEIPFTIEVPKSGSLEQAVSFFTDRESAPAVVEVKVADESPIPRLLRVKSGPRVTFSKRGDVREVELTTIEPLGSFPWLERFVCAPMEFAVVGESRIRADTHHDYILRTYTVAVRWAPLDESASRELYGRLSAATASRSGGPPGRLDLTGLIATAQHPCFPSTVRLSKASPEEIVLLAEAGGNWHLDGESFAPDWLEIQWDERAGAPRLRIALRGLPVDTPQTFRITLVDAAGNEASLPVTAIP